MKYYLTYSISTGGIHSNIPWQLNTCTKYTKIINITVLKGITVGVIGVTSFVRTNPNEEHSDHRLQTDVKVIITGDKQVHLLLRDTISQSTITLQHWRFQCVSTAHFYIFTHSYCSDLFQLCLQFEKATQLHEE